MLTHFVRVVRGERRLGAGADAPALAAEGPPRRRHRSRRRPVASGSRRRRDELSESIADPERPRRRRPRGRNRGNAQVGVDAGVIAVHAIAQVVSGKLQLKRTGSGAPDSACFL